MWKWLILDRYSRKAQLLCAILSALISGCSGQAVAPDLGGIYNRAAQTEDLDRNPVIVIPGILGSRLKDAESGSLSWGAFGGGSIDPTTPEGIRSIALPMRIGVPLSQLEDEVIPDGVLSKLKISLLGLPLELNAYREILNTLGAGGYRDQDLAAGGDVNYGSDHFTCFQHAYDWRRDISESAAILGEFILARRAYVQKEIERRFGISNHPVKFDIVAHSMGGLLARYYLMYGTAPLPEDGSIPEPTWEGARYVGRLIMIGTPNAGSVHAFRELVEGVQFSAITPKYEAALLGTMPAVYQLLPRPRHRAIIDLDKPDHLLDIYSADEWIRRGWGLADSEQEKVLEALLPDVGDPALRRETAIDHLRKSLGRAKQLAEALDRTAQPPPTLSIYLIAGDSEPTPAVLGLRDSEEELKVVRSAPGDGTVLRSSALLDERVGSNWTRRLSSPIPWRHVTFIFRDHLALTQDPIFTDNILFLLLEQSKA
ncbi:MAG: hypothetical protein DCC75_05260 [Proteobacteria bacterium]|nr:MAG: hypothetical protein DCC75_05260 [Pseudomonadota bacterium]